MRRLNLSFGISLVLHCLFVLIIALFLFRSDSPLSGGGGGSTQVEVSLAQASLVQASLAQASLSPTDPGKLSESRSTTAIKTERDENAGGRSDGLASDRTAGFEGSAGTGSPAPGLPAPGPPHSVSGSGPSGDNLLLAQIRSRIEQATRYPLLAQGSGQEGKVGLNFRIDEKGHPSEINIDKSSGQKIFDEEAIATIRRGAPYPPYNKSLPVVIRFLPN